jgi:hypothetical protein
LKNKLSLEQRTTGHLSPNKHFKVIPRNAKVPMDIRLVKNKNKQPPSINQQSDLIVIEDSDISKDEYEFSCSNDEISLTKKTCNPSLTVMNAELREKLKRKSKKEDREKRRISSQNISDLKQQKYQQAKMEARHPENPISSELPLRAKSQRIIQQSKDKWKTAIRQLSYTNLSKNEKRRLRRIFLRSEREDQKRFVLSEENGKATHSITHPPIQEDSDSSFDEIYVPLQIDTFRYKERPVSPTPSDSQENTTKDFLSSHCWVCHKRVKELDGKPCLYAMHLHPILMVPCCLICCDEIQAIDIPDDQDDLETCMGCAREGSLLLCDMCPRGFCEACTAQAWGGGASGRQQVERLIKDNNRSWACLTCNPPQALTSLQILDSQKLGENDIKEDNDDVASRLVTELDALEDDLESCEKLLEEENLKRLKKEIYEELSESIPCGNKLDEKVDEELESWKAEHLEHMIRVQDNKADILERLNACGISDDQYYNYRAERHPKAVSTDEYNSEWRRNADLEIDRRIIEEQKISSYQKNNQQGTCTHFSLYFSIIHVL